MTTSAPQPYAAPSAWRAWIHLGVLVVLAGIVDAVGTLSGSGAGGGGQQVIRHLPGFYFGALPVLAAISVGMLRCSSAAPRQGLVMALAVTFAMLVLDWVSGGAPGGEARVAFEPGGLATATRAADYTGISLLRSLIAMLRGDLVIPAIRSSRYARGDPFLVAAFSVLKVGHLLLPVILVGIVLGIQAWVADHVMFRRPVDEMVARILLAWVFVPAAFYLAVSWALRLLFQVLFRGASLFVPLLPFVTLLILSAVGWYASWRVSRWLE